MERYGACDRETALHPREKQEIYKSPQCLQQSGIPFLVKSSKLSKINKTCIRKIILLLPE